MRFRARTKADAEVWVLTLSLGVVLFRFRAHIDEKEYGDALYICDVMEEKYLLPIFT